MVSSLALINCIFCSLAHVALKQQIFPILRSKSGVSMLASSLRSSASQLSDENGLGKTFGGSAYRSIYREPWGLLILD
ncbi:hypothetical protein BU25DRAFT_127855 [Macroventuria anomochaeta]|uniref:Uncharacterized protein n=1 Tax=Macroventuria anomochaeta TaxID=301207 RepID=A0ACB6RT16_9PLEO|nr:uncharacterized protein BU25DRAFT_127855 [Macroventuria anomochaeta]KAF2624868.1 hypothetical protein BU25DRAFT_127855 [Macroventuria anomochaeta]